MKYQKKQYFNKQMEKNLNPNRYHIEQIEQIEHCRIKKNIRECSTPSVH